MRITKISNIRKFTTRIVHLPYWLSDLPPARINILGLPINILASQGHCILALV